MSAGIVLDVVVRHDQDWVGGAYFIVPAVVLMVAGIFSAQSLAVRALPVNEPDTRDLHPTCSGDDCDRILCLHEQPAACPGTLDRGCEHPGSMVCDNHRLDECDGCRIDAKDDAGVLG